MKATVAPDEDNKVKLSVEVDEAELSQEIDQAFRKLSSQVNIPGFRPGKAPRQIIEARLGAGVAREEAVRSAIPRYYEQAVLQTNIEPIAPPEIDITDGWESGPLLFNAVVEVMPHLDLQGYRDLKVSIDPISVSEEEVDQRLERLRDQFGHLEEVTRPAKEKDHIRIDIRGSQNGQAVEGITAEDYVYELGSASLVEGLDEKLEGSKAGDIFEFTSPVSGVETSFKVLVKDVKEKILPELNDEFASEASEFDTLEELRNDVATKLDELKKLQARLALNDNIVRELIKLVDQDPPKALVDQEIERRAHDLGHRLESEGASLQDYLNATQTTQEQLIQNLTATSIEAVKADLALRAVAEDLRIEVSDSELDTEIERLALNYEQKPKQFRRELENNNQIEALRGDIKKGKALTWLIDNIELIDTQGNVVDLKSLEILKPDDSELEQDENPLDKKEENNATVLNESSEKAQ